MSKMMKGTFWRKAEEVTTQALVVAALAATFVQAVVSLTSAMRSLRPITVVESYVHATATDRWFSFLMGAAILAGFVVLLRHWISTR